MQNFIIINCILKFGKYEILFIIWIKAFQVIKKSKNNNENIYI